MSTISHSDDHKIDRESNLKVNSFIKGEPSPFPYIDFSSTSVYELTDFTFRTPMEKMDVFDQMLKIPHPCELWILPVTEKAASLLKGMPKDETYEKTAALFTMFSKVKKEIEANRTFLVVHKEMCEEVIHVFQKLGFTTTKKTKEQLSLIHLS